MGFSGGKQVGFLQTRPKFLPRSFGSRSGYLATGDEDNLRRHTRDFGRMHADDQMPLLTLHRQPALDEVVARLEVETGKRFVQTKQIHVTRPCENFGEDDARLLAISLGKDAVTLILEFQFLNQFLRQIAIKARWIETENDLERRQALGKIRFVRQEQCAGF